MEKTWVLSASIFEVYSYVNALKDYTTNSKPFSGYTYVVGPFDLTYLLNEQRLHNRLCSSEK